MFTPCNKVLKYYEGVKFQHFCCCCSVAQLCPRLQPHGLQHARFPSPSPSPGVHWAHLVSIESVMTSNNLILCHTLLLPSIFPSMRFFFNELVLHIRWLKCWSFTISPSNEYSILISFRTDWFDLLAVQGTLKSLLQHHSSKASTWFYSDLVYLGQSKII